MYVVFLCFRSRHILCLLNKKGNKYEDVYKRQDKKCPKCGGYMIEKGSKLVCADETCGYVESKNDKEQ